MENYSAGKVEKFGYLFATFWESRNEYTYRVKMDTETLNAIEEVFPEVFKRVKVIGKGFFELVIPVERNEEFLDCFGNNLSCADSLADLIDEWRELAPYVARQKEIEAQLKQIALGEGEARRRELLIQADNLEELRLKIYKEVMLGFACEIGKQKWVPDMVVGGQTTPSGASSSNAISDIMNMLNVMIANQLRIQTSELPQGAQAVSAK